MISNSIARRWQVRFPDPATASASGLVAYGGDLLPHTLLSAYCQGIFPWYSEGEPILWWSPDPRCILLASRFRISPRSKRKIRHSNFSWSVDCAFKEVLLGCAMPRKGFPDTWLTLDMQEAYQRMFELGFAHSFEIWQEERLVGGLYGLAIGNVFFGESMFRIVSEASRAALVCLVRMMEHLDILLLDCQVSSPHMLAMGAVDIPRKEFLNLVVRDDMGLSGFLPRCAWSRFTRTLGEIEGISLRR